MKYCKESGRFIASAEEFVTSAKRGIFTHAIPAQRLPDDRRFIPKDACDTELAFDFGDGNNSFTLTALAHTRQNEIFIVKRLGENAVKPTKDDEAEARGEGFILAHMLMKSKKLDAVVLTLVYINRNNGVRIDVNEQVDAPKAEKFFKKCENLFYACCRPELERVGTRLPSMKDACFPYGRVREGQHEFIGTVYRNLTRGGTLFAMAPTGTGKTVSVIYPAVRALGAGKCDKVFYFTPKTTTATAAKDCIEEMSRSGVRIKAVMISAKERICRRGVLCRDGRENCDNSKCRDIKDAVMELFDLGMSVVTEKELTAVAEKYKVCPHELSLTYSELCDVVILDVNYLFDPRVYIKRYFTVGGSFAFLIDEAHNLPDRAREMYSAEISVDEVGAPALAVEIGEFSSLRATAKNIEEQLKELLYPYIKDEIRKDKDGVSHAFAHLSEPPIELYSMFSELASVTEAELLTTIRSKDEERDLRLKFLRDYLKKISRVNDALNTFDNGFEMFVRLDADVLSFKLFCIDPSKLIAKRLSCGHAAVFFSATLAPLSYYRSVLGGDRSSSVLEIESPFDPSQLSVTVMDKISTRQSEREDTLLAVSRAIAACVSAKRGHYMIFSPSFAYSEALARSFESKYPKIKVLTQKRDMTKKEKDEFIGEFTKNEGTYLVAFCVMGGIYSEGIDLAGDSLIGAVIVGIGMPALSVEREAIAAYYDEKCDEGKQYAYIYPGMNRVFQAAGRVIRREGDRGVIVLIDDRFRDPIYKKSIPDLWADMAFSDDPKSLRERLDKFWIGEKST